MAHNKHITIYGEKLSPAQAYAETYGYSFIVLNEATPETA